MPLGMLENIGLRPFSTVYTIVPRITAAIKTNIINTTILRKLFFKLEHQTFKNAQPYSISCIAVEPDEDVKIEKDTIQLINDVLADTALSGWYKTVLAEKQAQAQSGKSDSARNKALMWISNHI